MALTADEILKKIIESRTRGGRLVLSEHSTAYSTEKEDAFTCIFCDYVVPGHSASCPEGDLREYMDRN